MAYRIKSGLTFFILAFIFCSNIPAGENLFRNGGMEEGTETTATGWILQAYKRELAVIKRSMDNPYAGLYAISIQSSGANDIRLYQPVNVTPNTVYKVSGWVKTDSIGKGNTGANLSLKEHFFFSLDIKGTHRDWELLEMYFQTAHDTQVVSVCFGIGGYASTNKGQAFFDELVMERVEQAPENLTVFQIPSTKKIAETGSKQDTTGSTIKNVLHILMTPPPLLPVVLIAVGVLVIPLLLVIFVLKKPEKPLILRENLLDHLPRLKKKNREEKEG